MLRSRLIAPMPLRALRPVPVHVPRLATAAPVTRSFMSTPPQNSVRGWLWRKRTVRYPVYACGAILFSTVTVLGGLLIWDAMTYHHIDLKSTMVPSLVEAPHGGPDNLAILPPTAAESELPPSKRKERLVVIGGGWRR